MSSELFRKGSVVVWDFEAYPVDRKDPTHPYVRYGDGPFVVLRTWSVELSKRKGPKRLGANNGHAVVTWGGVNHKQFVEIALRKRRGRLKYVGSFSGAYFKRARDAKKR